MQNLLESVYEDYNNEIKEITDTKSLRDKFNAKILQLKDKYGFSTYVVGGSVVITLASIGLMVLTIRL